MTRLTCEVNYRMNLRHRVVSTEVVLGDNLILAFMYSMTSEFGVDSSTSRLGVFKMSSNRHPSHINLGSALCRFRLDFNLKMETQIIFCA